MPEACSLIDFRLTSSPVRAEITRSIRRWVLSWWIRMGMENPLENDPLTHGGVSLRRNFHYVGVVNKMVWRKF